MDTMSNRPPLHQPPQRYYRTGGGPHFQPHHSAEAAPDSHHLERRGAAERVTSNRLQDEARLRRYQRILNEKELKLRVRSTHDDATTHVDTSAEDHHHHAGAHRLTAAPRPWQEVAATFSEVTREDDGFHTHHTAGVAVNAASHAVDWAGSAQDTANKSNKSASSSSNGTNARDTRRSKQQHAVVDQEGQRSSKAEDAAHYWEQQYHAMRSKCATVSKRLVEVVQDAHEREMSLVRQWGQEQAAAHAELDASLTAIEKALREALPLALRSVFESDDGDDAAELASSANRTGHHREAQAYRIVAMAHAVSAQRKLDHAVALKASDRIAAQLAPVLQQVSDAARILFHTLHVGGSGSSRLGATRASPAGDAREQKAAGANGGAAQANVTRPPLSGGSEAPLRRAGNPPPSQEAAQQDYHRRTESYVPLDCTPSPKPKAPHERSPIAHDDAFALLRERLAANRLGSHTATSDDESRRASRHQTTRGSPSSASTQFELHYVQPLQHHEQQDDGSRASSGHGVHRGSGGSGARRSASAGGGGNRQASAVGGSPRTRPTSVASSSPPVASETLPVQSAVQAACDVLRDIYHALEGVVSTVDERSVRVGEAARDGDDPMDQLLSSFQTDLQHLTRSSLQQLKAMSRRMLRAAASAPAAACGAPHQDGSQVPSAQHQRSAAARTGTLHHHSMSSVDVACTDDDRAASAGGICDRSLQLDIEADDDEDHSAAAETTSVDEGELTTMRAPEPRRMPGGGYYPPVAHAQPTNRRIIAFIPAPDVTPPRDERWRLDDDARHTVPSSANSSVTTAESHRRRVVISPLLDE